MIDSMSNIASSKWNVKIEEYQSKSPTGPIFLFIDLSFLKNFLLIFYICKKGGDMVVAGWPGKTNCQSVFICLRIHRNTKEPNFLQGFITKRGNIKRKIFPSWWPETDPPPSPPLPPSRLILLPETELMWGKVRGIWTVLKIFFF